MRFSDKGDVRMYIKKIISLLCVGSVVLSLAACGQESETLQTSAPATSTPKTDVNDLGKLTENTIDATITLTNGDTIELELYPDVAPKTVSNFVKYVQEGFYTGTIFHRTIEDFIIQGGGYDTDYNLKSVSETVEGEFESNGIENDLSHVRGVISMARIPSENDSASTQFFIVQADSTYLDGDYAAFGKVTDGMDVVDEIASSKKMADPPAGLEDVPETQYEIQSITIDSEIETDEPSGDSDSSTAEPDESQQTESSKTFEL